MLPRIDGEGRANELRRPWPPIDADLDSAEILAVGRLGIEHQRRLRALELVEAREAVVSDDPRAAGVDADLELLACATEICAAPERLRTRVGIDAALLRRLGRVGRGNGQGPHREDCENERAPAS